MNMELLERFVAINSADPDDSRRRRLLNVILLGTAFAVLLTALVIAAGTAFGTFKLGPGLSLVGISVVSLIGFAIIFAVNRYFPGRSGSILFMVFLLVVIGFSDTPAEVASGRSLFLFVIPIVVSSVLLAPGASFVFYGLSVAEIFILARAVDVSPNVPAITSFLLLALLSWLSSRSLEQALHELRDTNANLDKLVNERTQALSDALARERVETGQRQAILNSIADGVIVFDHRRQSTLANPAVHDLLDVPVEQVVNRTFDDLLANARLSDANREALHGMLDMKTQPTSLRVEWGDRTLAVNAAEVRDDKGEDLGTVAVFHDYSREAEIDRMKSRFVAIVSHELRTPLNAIMGFAEMLREGVYGQASEKQVEASRRILLNTQRMLGMVGDLLDQAQIEAGRLKVESKPFHLTEVLENVHVSMDQVVNEKGLMLQTEVDPRLPEMLVGDSARLQQILVNLVNNSVKFTESGEIRVRLYLSDPTHWAMEVSDTGGGIPDGELDHIFDAFHQVDSTTTRRAGGFGLGLSIVKQLVHLMNGDIKVQSSMGRGSLFTVTLPLSEADLERKKSMNQLALIIEDDVDLASIFSEALKSAGFDTQVIRDGALAQKRIKETAPHIVILDLHLPHVDGSILLDDIRSDKALKNTVVVVATADALMGEMYRESADIVLIKPISFTQLRDLSVRLRTTLTL